MYYEEQIIDGELCSRTTPEGKWTPFTLEQTRRRIDQMRQEQQAQRELVAMYEPYRQSAQAALNDPSA